jgi:hypothetical protein
VTQAQQELDSLRATAAQTQQAVSGLDQRAAGLDQRIGGVDQRLGGLNQRLGGVDQRLDALQKGLGNIETVLRGVEPGALQAALKAPETVTAVAARVDGLEKTQAAAQDRALLGLAAAELQSAVAKGAPFTTALDAVARLKPDDASVQALRPYADKGVPTTPELIRRFGPVDERMRAALAPANGGAIGRLLGHAQSIVRVTPVGPAAGGGADTALSRMEAAVADGDLERALKEREALPEEAKRVSADWAQAARARLEAEALVGRLSAEMMSRFQPR